MRVAVRLLILFLLHFHQLFSVFVDSQEVVRQKLKTDVRQVLKVKLPIMDL